jgi:diguanylate cyclase (GGDEF)-like protein
MTETLLKHLVEITGHRDHALLDTSVLSALHELIGAKQVRVLEIFRQADALLVRPRVWINNGKVASLEENADAQHDGVPLADYPVLIDCIEQRHASAAEIAADGSHILWMPVWTNDKVTACIEISSAAPYSSQMLHVIEGILSVYRNYQNLIDYSERDSLTGLYNRKTFDEKFSRMVSAAAPHENPAAQNQDERRLSQGVCEQWLAVVDIDHFKRVNDTFGHLYGDEVLILIANLLRSSFRSEDRVFRFGGEEFVILLRSTTLDNALRIFERFRSNVEKYDFPQVGQVTVSLGFVRISQYETPVVILGHADQALYHAKSNGRNRVCHYDELVNEGLLQSGVSNDTAEFFFDEPAAS